MTRLLVDAEQIRTFASSVFRYASDGQIVSLRTFRDDGSNGPAIKIHPVKVNGSGLEDVIEAAIIQAQWAADHGKKVVFCPPIAGFSNMDKADEASLSEGYALSVECDQRPADARQKLELLLGSATLVVASGGLWTDEPSTTASENRLRSPLMRRYAL